MFTILPGYTTLFCRWATASRLAIRLPSRPVTTEEAEQQSAHTTMDGIPSQGPTSSSDESPLPVTYAIQHIEATQGRVTLHDPVVSGSGVSVHSLDEVDIRISNFAPGEPMTFQVALHDAAKTGFGSLTGRGRLWSNIPKMAGGLILAAWDITSRTTALSLRSTMGARSSAT